jgi:hypothetical protein
MTVESSQPFRLRWDDLYAPHEEPGDIARFATQLEALAALWRYTLNEGSYRDGSSTYVAYFVAQPAAAPIRLPLTVDTPNEHVAKLIARRLEPNFYLKLARALQADLSAANPNSHGLRTPDYERYCAIAPDFSEPIQRNLERLARYFQLPMEPVRIGNDWIIGEIQQVHIRLSGGGHIAGGGYDSGVTEWTLAVHGLTEQRPDGTLTSVRFCIVFEEVDLAGWYSRVECDQSETSGRLQQVLARK